jgi:hypothetical protein
MSLSSPPPAFADREQPTSGRRLRALRGREEIARLTARLRSEQEQYESVSQSWSAEADEKKKELRKARADTLVEIGAVLAWLGDVERLREIERLPFEQKLAQLDAFLEDDTQGGSAAAAPPREGNPPPDPIPTAVAEASIAILEARPEPATPDEAPRAARESTPPAPRRPRSMRPPSRRPMGHWPVRLAPPPTPRPATWRIPLLVGVIAIQGLALAVLSLAVSLISSRHSESDPSRAAASNATTAATTVNAMATPLPPPAPQQPAESCVPSAQPVVVPAGEPRPAAAAQTPRRAAPPPRPPARWKPAAAPSLPELARRPEVFVPDSL